MTYKTKAYGAFILFFLTLSLVSVFLTPYDDTDKNGEVRSGLVLFTDHLTGC